MKSSRLKSSSSLSFFGLVWMMQQRLLWRRIKRALLISLLISTRRFNQTFTSWSLSKRSTKSRWSNRWKIHFDLYRLLYPIRKVRVFPYYARSNEKLKENFRAAISEGKSWQMESPKNSYASEQIGFILVEDHLVCFCSIANFEQKSIIGTLSRTLVKIQFVANAFEGISR